MKKITVFILLVLLVFPLFAEYDSEGNRSVFLQDIAVRLGHGVIVGGEEKEMGLHLLGGLSIGLSKRLEINPEVIFEVMPEPFSDAILGFELGYSVLGNRISEKQNSGTGINTLINLGFFMSDHNKKNTFAPTYLTLRITPICAGTSYSGKRSSLLPAGVAWNFRDNSFSLFFSAMIYDHYIKGSWKDDYK